MDQALPKFKTKNKIRLGAEHGKQTAQCAQSMAHRQLNVETGVMRGEHQFIQAVPIESIGKAKNKD